MSPAGLPRRVGPESRFGPAARFFRFVLLSLSLHFFLGNLGETGPALGRAAALACLYLFAAAAFPPIRWRLDRSLAIYLVPLVVATFVVARGTSSMLFIYPAWLASRLWLPEREDEAPGERETLLGGTFLFAALNWLILYVPSVWHFQHALGLGLSRLAGYLVGRDYLTGATVTGIPVLLQVATYFVAVALLGGRHGGGYAGRRLAVLAGVAMLTLMFLALRARPAGASETNSPWMLLNPQPLLFLAMVLTAAPRPPAWRPPRPRWTPGRWWLVGAGAALLVVGLATELGGSLRQNGLRVAIYNKGYLNLNRPVYGQYGARSGGMFGLLPDALQAYGDSVRMVESLGNDQIAGADVVVIINLMEFLPATERQALHDFVRRGGGLLLMGDHTGVQGIREPFNDLLRPAGIEFRFDSASFTRTSWEGSALVLPGFLSRGQPSADEAGMWVGAGLDIRPPARPVIVGRFGFSDSGDLSAVDNGYLGDRSYDPGEQLGDIVLVAERSLGKGKILVFGDTSTFQNGALPGTHAFVQRAMALAAGGNRSGAGGLVSLLALLLVAATVGLFLAADLRLAGAASLAMLLPILAATQSDPRPRMTRPPERLAVIEASHFERFTPGAWKDRGVGGFQYNLMRAGYFPVMGRHLNARQLSGCDLLVVTAPVTPFSRRDRALCRRFMESGGWILYACGYEEGRGSEKFLLENGVQLRNVPLTAFTDTLTAGPVTLDEAWGLGSPPASGEVLGEQYGYPYLLKVRQGAGGLVALADTGFYLNKNLENMAGFNEENILFLKWLLGSLPGRNGLASGTR